MIFLEFLSVPGGNFKFCIINSIINTILDTKLQSNQLIINLFSGPGPHLSLPVAGEISKRHRL